MDVIRNLNKNQEGRGVLFKKIIFKKWAFFRYLAIINRNN